MGPVIAIIVIVILLLILIIRNIHVVQQARAFSDRDSIRNFRLSGFVDDPTMVQGGVDVSLLPAGAYHISFVCQIVTGESFTVRQLQYICE